MYDDYMLGYLNAVCRKYLPIHCERLFDNISIFFPLQPAPAVGTKLEGLLFDDDFNPSTSSVPVYSPPVVGDGLDIFAAGPLNNGAHNGTALNGQKIQNAPPEIPVRCKLKILFSSISFSAFQFLGVKHSLRKDQQSSH